MSPIHRLSTCLGAAALACSVTPPPNEFGGGTGAESSSSSSGAETSSSAATTAELDASSSSEGAPPGDTGVFDVGAPDDPGDCDGDTFAYSYIWIANAEQGTISKVDTITMQEVGRYLTRPDGAGSPSRTSVGTSANVAVANRNGGLTKLYADVADCVESNGIPGIQTSTGRDDVLDWGVEECVAWHTPMDYGAQRPVAWVRSEITEGSCDVEGERVWTSGADPQDPASLEVLRVDGDTGTVLDVVPIPQVNATGWGGYGGAADGDGNFWMTFYGGSKDLVRVDAQTLAVDVYEMPLVVAYGMTVDSEGSVWICGGGVARFDPATETFVSDVHDVAGTHTDLYQGCMADTAGRLWVSRLHTPNMSIRAVDTESLAILETILMPTTPKGISIDFEGHVWAIDTIATAYRYDPTTGEMLTYAGLTGPYTYSDMTGYALAHAGAAG